MPYLLIKTNKEITQSERPGLLSTLSARASEWLGKSENFVMIALEQAQDMSFAGSSAPCAYLEFKSLGLPTEQATELSDKLCQTLHELLAIEPARIYIEFASPERSLWGWNSKTF